MFFFKNSISGDDLRALRKRKGVSMQKMADKIGVSLRTIENWETGVGQPRVDQFLQICIYCSIDIKGLMHQIRECDAEQDTHRNDKFASKK
ncbi:MULTISPECIES: helix-turn-helix domain-containing protein [Pseudoalteromonas]|uniref:helix-turn-helix domain-containing protein n=1 Tax=Pseudoalteromonas TaxID=53246 RepID=UPI000BAE1411|nr:MULTISPECIES: helix-turn-helix transcriptional regulator [unclassified Pseudoalteromonas]MCX2769574.1 helix-turn-helix transcriptional regulator [Pseudoalteromonas sp. B530]PAY02530.1 MerR family transcriptional regulator [Pseudoalteromonas sp. HM-SA03]TMN32688.1 XRE family transcriptional regulator [Pseudoalteromonas sp. S2755]